MDLFLVLLLLVFVASAVSAGTLLACAAWSRRCLPPELNEEPLQWETPPGNRGSVEAATPHRA
jgi:hypothetical protein